MENTAKNFALQLGAVATLYIVVISLINLLFSVITVAFPDSVNGPWETTSASSSIRISIAFLIVFFPTYITLTRILNTIRRKEQGTYLTLTKWVLYLSLLVGGGVLLGDLVAILIQFLNGEITIRFILKAITVFLVVGTAFAYYVADVRGYWQLKERNSIYYGVAVGLFVIASIVLGFGHTESPTEVREKRIDAEQVNVLINIQSTIESYVAIEGKLPESLSEAYGALPIPQATDGRMQYEYTQKSATQFSLCAEFKTSETEQWNNAFLDKEAIIKNPNSWNHTEGVWCFDRTVNTIAIKR